MSAGSRSRNLVLWGLVALALAVSLYVAVKRFQRERALKGTEIVLDFDSLLDLVNNGGLDMSGALAQLREAGVSAIAFPEDNLGTLQEEGALMLYRGIDFERACRMGIDFAGNDKGNSALYADSVNPTRIYLAVNSPSVARQVHTYLNIFIGPDRVKLWPGEKSLETLTPSRKSPVIFEVTGREKYLATLGVGFSRERLEFFARRGFHVYLRPENKDGCTVEMAARYMRELTAFPRVAGLVFSGVRNEVTGYPDGLDCVVDAAVKMKWNVGMIEVPTLKVQQKGIQHVAQKAPGRIVRVQSIVPGMQAKMTPLEAVDMYLLGARERNIRLQYVRLFTQSDSGKDVTTTNLDFLRSLKSEMAQAGLATGRASALGDYEPSLLLVVLISLGAAAAAILFLELFIPVSLPVAAALLALAPLGTIGFSVVHHLALWKKLLALGCGWVFPVIGIALCFARIRELAGCTGFRMLVARTTAVMARVSAVTLMGGLLIVGLLADTEFLLQIDMFRGIKLLMALPPLTVLYLWLTKGCPNPTPLSMIFNIPLRLIHLLASLVIVVAGVVMMARTGNAPDVGAPSELEITVRNLLEKALVARPRFKEFAMGHPSFFLLSALPSRGILTGQWLWLFIVAVGQADMVDTFAHLHTPLVPTLIRIGNGLVIGWLLGVAAAWLIWRLTAKNQEPQADAGPHGT